MNNAAKQIEEIKQAKRELAEELRKRRDQHHEEGAKLNDQLTHLLMGERR